MTDRRTIVALATPPGRSAIAILRISGPAAVRAAAGIGVHVPPEPRMARRGALRDVSGEIVDDAVILFFPGPGSYTGEDLIELHLHGSRAVIQKCLAILLAQPDIRLAEPGEFTRRAFAAGKMDIVSVEALGDLIDSDTEQQRRQAIQALGGGLQLRAIELREHLIDAESMLTAAIDFSDEDDVSPDVLQSVRAILMEATGDVRRLLETARGAELVRDGVRVALLGRPNAGKSTLLNALARRDVAIVSETPGTTRDRISVQLELGGFAVTLTDTAGLRESDDRIEQMGVRRGLEAAQEADIVIWLSDGTDQHAPPAEFDDRLLLVRSKADLSGGSETSGPPRDGIPLSVVTNLGLDVLISALQERIASLTGQRQGVVVTRERQRLTLMDALSACERALALEDGHPELMSEELRRAGRSLDALIGRVGVEDVLDRVFSKFCIGK